jgi:hypothetical protein
VVPLTSSSDGTDYVFDAAKEEPVWHWQGKETEWVPMAGTKRLSAE